MESASNFMTSRQNKSFLEQQFRRDLLDRDFWVVERGYDDNFNVLQDYLDDLFNSIPGNYYAAEYLESQSKTRLAIKCWICNTSSSSYDPFFAHDGGKNHKKLMQQNLAKEQQYPNVGGPLIFKSFRDTAKTFDSGTLEEKLSKTSQLVVGYQFVYAEVFYEEKVYTCQLCRKITDSFRMDFYEAFNHLTSDCHAVQYMKVKYNTSKPTFDQLYPELKEIEKLEGKIQTPIITIRSGDLFEEHMKKRSKNIQEKLESPSRLSNDRSKSPLCKHSPTLDKLITPPTPKSLQPETPPLLVKDVACLTEPPSGNIIDFVKELQELKSKFSKVSDLPELLKDDLDAQDLLIRLVKVLTQKMYLFSLKKDSALVEPLRRLLSKSEKFSLLPLTTTEENSENQ